MYGDQIVQARLRPVEFSGADRWVGLVARYIDDANYHYVTLRDSNSVWLRKLVNGVPQTLAIAPLDVRENVTYGVRLESVGTQLRVYINGSLLLETADASVPEQPSGAGVAMYKTAADVGNFSVLNP
jgi:pectate lyase